MPRRDTPEARAKGAINQTASRRVNEEIAKVRFSSSFDSYVCECRKKKCIAPIKLTRDEYAEIRRDPHQFVVLPGHSAPKFERIVRRTPGFEVVVAIVEPVLSAVPDPAVTTPAR